MAITHARRSRGISGLHQGPAAIQLTWFAAVTLLSFLVPAVFSSLLELQHDAYLLIYFTAVLGALGAYAGACHVDWAAQFRARWRLSLVLGAAAAAFVVWSVLARLDSTPHPSGPYIAFEIAWRGAVYGIVDALLLSAFPGFVAFNLMQGKVAGAARRVLYGALTLALVIVITAVYHFGYKDLRSGKGIGQPVFGNTIISVPVIASANPVGSVIAHTSMHLAAVTHAYESKDRLPPQVFVNED
jgi:hypothetical protein